MKPLPQSEFEDLVREAVETLPEQFLARLENVDVVVEDEPRPDQLQENGVEGGGTLLGLYEGVPLIHRHEYGFVVPDKITIFQRPIEAICRSRAQVIREVQSTVVHEVAHYFGIDDDALEEWGL